MTEFNPLDSFEKMAHRWWWVGLAMVLGGLLGFAAAFILKPIYEARAELYVNMNEAQYAADNHLEYVTDLERSSVMDPVMGFFYTSSVVDAVGLAAQQNGIVLDTENFEYEFKLTRIFTRWLLVVRRADPQEAATLANLWAQKVLDELNAAYPHAVNAQALELQMTALKACFQQNDLAEANTCAGTQFQNNAELETYLADLSARDKVELSAARNLDYTLDFRLAESAAAPLEPVLYRRSLLILAGALIGFILGAFFAAR